MSTHEDEGPLDPSPATVAPMESVGDIGKGWLKDMRAKIAGYAERAKVEHEAILASLPPGTCASCYGRGCYRCEPPLSAADGTPYEFVGATLDNYRVDVGNAAALEKARTFLENDRDLYLCGGVGAGKTRLACSVANTWQKRGRSAWFVRVPMMLHQLQPGGLTPDAAREMESRLFHVPLLVLDDIGAERDQATDFTRRTLLMIYEARHDRGRRTVFTSNKSLTDLGDMQDDDRLSSRIAGRCDVVRLTTSDQRLARRK